MPGRHLSPLLALEQLHVGLGREDRRPRGRKRLLLGGRGWKEPHVPQCSGAVTKAESTRQALCLQPASAEQAESPKHPCEPGEVNTHTHTHTRNETHPCLHLQHVLWPLLRPEGKGLSASYLGLAGHADRSLLWERAISCGDLLMPLILSF